MPGFLNIFNFETLHVINMVDLYTYTNLGVYVLQQVFINKFV